MKVKLVFKEKLFSSTTLFNVVELYSQKEHLHIRFENEPSAMYSWDKIKRVEVSHNA